MASVGTVCSRPDFVSICRNSSNEKKKNALSCLMGPPMVAPKLLRRFVGRTSFPAPSFVYGMPEPSFSFA